MKHERALAHPIAAAVSMALLGCAGIQSGGQSSSTGTVPPPTGLVSPNSDTTGLALVPAGYGTLHQDDLAFHITSTGILIRALPLDEALIRLLTPDSYKAMRDLQQSSRAKIDSVSRRYGGRPVSVWFVSFYGVEPDAQFTPGDLIVTSSGRDFRPYEVVPLTTGFGEQRLRQRETQSALYLYDGDVELNQLVVVSYQGTSDDTWDQTLQRIERERAMIRARDRKGDRATP